MRARNIVVEGEFKNCNVVASFGVVSLMSRFKTVTKLDSATVEFYKLIAQDGKVSMASAAIRGFAGEMLLGPVGLSAAFTAKRHEVFYVGVAFKKGRRSVLEINERIMRVLEAQPLWLNEVM